MTEDQLFRSYVDASGEDRAELELELHARLSRHATAVVWQMMRERRPDIVAEAVDAVLMKPEAFRGDSKFTTWFEAIVRNICRRKLRYTIKHKKDVPLDDLELPTGERIAEEVHSRLELERLTESLDEEGQALVRAKLAGHDEDGIAQQLGITPAAVRSRWHRVRNRLKDLSLEPVA